MNNLKKIRTEKKMSQFELAKLSNVMPTDISRIENNRIYAYPGWRKRISIALNVSEDEVFPEHKSQGEAVP